MFSRMNRGTKYFFWTLSGIHHPVSSRLMTPWKDSTISICPLMGCAMASSNFFKLTIPVETGVPGRLNQKPVRCARCESNIPWLQSRLQRFQSRLSAGDRKSRDVRCRWKGYHHKIILRPSWKPLRSAGLSVNGAGAGKPAGISVSAVAVRLSFVLTAGA